MGPHVRIIDANANRAREAARVLEDVARFALNDQGLAAAFKGVRHDLRAALVALGLDSASLTAWRDTPGDVGTSITAAAEGSRSDVLDIATAAGKRLGEALRVLEEFAKVGGAPPLTPAESIKQLRYRAYEFERRLLLALGTGRAVQWRLCVLITEALCRPLAWQEVARRAIRGGADCLQLREKSLPDCELLDRAKWLVKMARSSELTATVGSEGVASRPAIIVNDRPDIAALAGADGVHLGQNDLSVEAVRRIAGRTLLVGVSTENLEQARTAAAAGADYCGVGPMFATQTKDKPRLAGPDYLRSYLAEFGPTTDAATARRMVPHLAIGGISPENIAELASVGCRGVAVSSCVCGSAEPERACRALIEGLGGRERAVG